jgi:hypothetical protein
MRTKRKAKEESLQISVSKYLRLQYPNTIFTAESSGIRLTMGQAVKAKKQRSTHKQLDLWILEPRGKYHGLIIELKKDGESPFKKKDGTLKAGEHLSDQYCTIQLLKYKGYAACFSVGFDQTKTIIDDYMRM